MRLIATLTLIVATAFQALAQPPSYHYIRKFVEDQNPKDKTPAAERIFACYNYKDSVIVRFREGITLREVIDKSTRKGKRAQVRIHRPDRDVRPVFSEADLKPIENPKFVIKPGDVIFLQEPFTPQA